jgi:hypothetical protein
VQQNEVEAPHQHGTQQQHFAELPDDDDIDMPQAQLQNDDENPEVQQNGADQAQQQRG